MSSEPEKVRVVVRSRPLSSKEVEHGCHEVVFVNSNEASVTFRKSDDDSNPRTYYFNSAYSNNVTQQFIYDDCARPIVDSVLEGYHGTIFAYGQTGTGKTYTMEGIPTPEHEGIIPHSINQIFAHISRNQKDKRFLVVVTYLEIYLEKVYDLLSGSRDPLHVRVINDNVTIPKLTSYVVKSADEVNDLLEKGRSSRSVRATEMNPNSSRSHSIFSISVEQQDFDGSIKVGKLNLVDLAGSERSSKTKTNKEGSIEGNMINKSLLELGNVISALIAGKTHIPYRNSTLTTLIKSSLGGNSKTLMFATLGPANTNFEESYATLLWATRASKIKNKPKVNEDPKDAMLNKLKDEINKLREMLNNQDHGNQVGSQELNELETNHMKQLEELMAEKTMNEVQKAELKKKLEAEFQKQKQMNEESEKLKQRIAEMEQSVIVGGVNLMDTAKQQEEEIRVAQCRTRQQREKQQKLNEKRLKHEEEILFAEKQYGSLKEELSSKVHKIRKIKPVISRLKNTMEDMQNQFNMEKEAQETELKEMDDELLFLQHIIDNFIPSDSLEKIMQNTNYDERSGKFVITDIHLAGRNVEKWEFEEEEEEDDENCFKNVFFNQIEAKKAWDQIRSQDEEKKKKKREDFKKHSMHIFGVTKAMDKNS